MDSFKDNKIYVYKVYGTTDTRPVPPLDVSIMGPPELFKVGSSSSGVISTISGSSSSSSGGSGISTISGSSISSTEPDPLLISTNDSALSNSGGNSGSSSSASGGMSTITGSSSSSISSTISGGGSSSSSSGGIITISGSSISSTEPELLLISTNDSALSNSGGISTISSSSSSSGGGSTISGSSSSSISSTAPEPLLISGTTDSALSNGGGISTISGSSSSSGGGGGGISTISGSSSSSSTDLAPLLNTNGSSSTEEISTALKRRISSSSSSTKAVKKSKPSKSLQLQPNPNMSMHNEIYCTHCPFGCIYSEVNTKAAKLLKTNGFIGFIISPANNLCFYRTLSALLNNFPNIDEDEDAARELLVTIVEKAAIHQNIAKDEADAILKEIVTPLHWSERNTFKGLSAGNYLQYIADYFGRSFIMLTINIKTTQLGQQKFICERATNPDEILYLAQVPGMGSIIDPKSEYSMHYINVQLDFKRR